MAMLLKHSQLSKQYQLEIKVVDSDDKVLFHNSVGFLPIVGTFALYKPDESEWHAFNDIRGIVESIAKDDKFEDPLKLTITPHLPPTSSKPFEHQHVDTVTEGDLPEIKRAVHQVLKDYVVYASIEYES